MTTRRLRLLAPLAAAACALPACTDQVDYGYFAVQVSVDQPADADYLRTIATCGVNVEGADTDFGALSCAENRFTRRELGTFEWSTDTQSGTVAFTVTLKNGVGRVIGTGKSGEVAISVGNTVPATVLVTPVLPPPMQ